MKIKGLLISAFFFTALFCYAQNTNIPIATTNIRNSSVLTNAPAAVHTHTNATAIANIFQLQHQALFLSAHIVIDSGKITRFAINQRDYLKYIETIEPAACPERFRLAWFEYVHFLEKKDSSNNGLAMLFDLAALAQGGPLAFKKLPDLCARLHQGDLKEAWDQVEVIGRSYGVHNQSIPY